jgi:Dolichyl-phosphate-mannose-protein mannosyltransferase
VTSRRLLALVLLVAAAVRMWGLGFGLPYANSRVDETAVAGPAVQFLSGSLRPANFMYPTGMLYAVALLYATWYAVTKPFGMYASLAAFAESRRQSLAPFFYLSRGLSAAMGTLTVWWMFAICRRAFDETAGIVSALFLALAFLHVRDSHFGTLDVTMTALVVLSVLLILRWQQAPTSWRAAAAGLVAGLATSTKYNAFGVVVPFVMALALGAADNRATPGAAMRRTAGSLAAFTLAFAIGFLGATPYVVVAWRQFIADLNALSATLAGGHGLALSRGWWHHATITLPAALGWPLYLAGVAGTVGLMLTRLRASAVVLAFPLAYFIVAGSGYRVFARDVLPLLPFLCIAAGWLVVAAVRAILPASAPLGRGWATAAVALAIVAPSARNDILLDRVLTRTDNRVVVARELPALIPQGSLVYHSGEAYGRIPFTLSEPPLKIDLIAFDEATGQFTRGGRLPEWIILQRSPLVLYSHVPDGVQRIVGAHYERVREFAVTRDDRPRVYDQQDALFLPLSGLGGVGRLGPAFEIYRLRAR